MAAWGTLDGAYVMSQGTRPVIRGGKPVSLMRAIVRDYSRPGELVCDPCAGAGTTGVAAIHEGRRFAGWEIDPRASRIAETRLRVAMVSSPP
jgi:site-specific DNA-methyltransferase (adenine-specific)